MRLPGMRLELSIDTVSLRSHSLRTSVMQGAEPWRLALGCVPRGGMDDGVPWFNRIINDP